MSGLKLAAMYCDTDNVFPVFLIYCGLSACPPLESVLHPKTWEYK